MSAPASLASSIADLLLHLDLQEQQPETYEKQKPEVPENLSPSPSLHSLHQRRTSKTLSKTLSKLSKSSKSGIEHRVPRSQRRGPLAFLTIIPEYDDARNYSPTTKLWIVLVVAFAATTGPMGTSIMLPAMDDMGHKLNTSVSTVNVSVGVYLILLGVFPMWWSNFSERHGRRWVYVVSYIWFLAFLIGLALAPTILVFIVMRLLAGMGASAVQACGAATVADLYVIEERGTALGVFYLGPLLGPFLSPIIGGAVAEAWGWRATMWVMVIACGLNVTLLIFILPETLRQADLMAQVRQRLKEQMEKRKITDTENSVENTDSAKKDESEKVQRDNGMDGVHKDSQNGRKGQSGERLSSGNDNDTHSMANELNPNKRETPNPLDNRLKNHSDNNLDNNLDNLLDLDNHLSLLESLDSRLERIMSNLSHNSSLRRLILNDETPMDLVTPSLLRITTNHSAYSRRVQEFQIARAEMEEDEDEKPEGWAHHIYDYIVRPMHAVCLLAYPPATLAIFFSAISFMGVYFFNIAISNCYSADPYGYSSVIVGLMYIPNSVTYIIASIYGGRWNDWLIRRSATRNHGEMIPESRISWNIVLALSCYPPACMIFGWCIDKGVFWLVPLIGTALFGFASMLVIGVTLTYIIDVLPGKGATGVALNNLVRQILAAVATFITAPLIRALSVGVLFSIYLGVLMVCSAVLLFLKRRGGGLRQQYDITDYYMRL